MIEKECLNIKTLKLLQINFKIKIVRKVSEHKTRDKYKQIFKNIIF